MSTLKNNMRIHNNRKRTAGRDFQMLQIKHVVAFVVMPRFGNKVHNRQKIEVIPIDNKSLRKQSNFFVDKNLSPSKKAKLWKQVRKQAWEKNVNEAKNLADSYAKNYPNGDAVVLPIYHKTSMRLAA